MCPLTRTLGDKKFIFSMVELQGCWWFPQNPESQKGGKQSLENERRDPLLIILAKTSEDGVQEFNSIHFVTAGSVPADGGLP